MDPGRLAGFTQFPEIRIYAGNHWASRMGAVVCYKAYNSSTHMLQPDIHPKGQLKAKNPHKRLSVAVRAQSHWGSKLTTVCGDAQRAAALMSSTETLRKGPWDRHSSGVTCTQEVVVLALVCHHSGLHQHLMCQSVMWHKLPSWDESRIQSWFPFPKPLSPTPRWGDSHFPGLCTRKCVVPNEGRSLLLHMIRL